MYHKGFYKGLSQQEIEKKIREEGFDPIIFHNHPGDIYNKHLHAETKLLAFLKGSMEVMVADEKFSCRPGDKIIIPGNVKHSAVVGADGCTFFWSEKLM